VTETRDPRHLINRKLEHVEATVFGGVERLTSTMLDDITLVHQAFPGFSLEDVETMSYFLGKKISSPIMVTGMTGGTPELGRLNGIIASVVEEMGLVMGVGSERIVIENPSSEESFRVVRRNAPTSPLVANIGVPQLYRGYGLSELKTIISVIEADALAVHLNVAQEVFQPEGETDYREETLAKLRDLSKEIGIPVILKETGCGLSIETVRRFSSYGFHNFDVSGQGGTSWVAVEKLRGERRGNWKSRSASVFSTWGIPTAATIMETRWSDPTSFIIGSGGLRNGLDIAKAIALGADVGGFALPVLEASLEGKNSVRSFLNDVLFQLQAAMLMSGSKDVKSLRKASIVIRGGLKEWMESRGISLSTYDKVRKGGY
jgi:isopentenyl-diphosphate delta-isomerase